MSASRIMDTWYAFAHRFRSTSWEKARAGDGVQPGRAPRPGVAAAT